jgi:monodictyphenone polyketide synthase
MSKLEFTYFGNELPAEDLQDVFRRLHLHSKNAEHSLLASFISTSTQAIKEEVKLLPSETRKYIPPFDSILSWAEYTELRDGILCGAIGGVLLVVAQIATYIGSVEYSRS